MFKKLTGRAGQVGMRTPGGAVCRIIGITAATVADGGEGIMAIRPGVKAGTGLAGGTVVAGTEADTNTNIMIGTIDARRC